MATLISLVSFLDKTKILNIESFEKDMNRELAML